MTGTGRAMNARGYEKIDVRLRALDMRIKASAGSLAGVTDRDERESGRCVVKRTAPISLATPEGVEGFRLLAPSAS